MHEHEQLISGSDDDSDLNEVLDSELNFNNLNEGHALDTLESTLARKLLKLRENHNLSSSSISAVVDIIKNVGNKVKDNLIQQYRLLSENQDFEDWPAVVNSLSNNTELDEICENLDSQRKLESFAERNLFVVKPVELVVQTNDSTRETFQYVPILQTLEYLLKFEDIFAEVINGHRSSDRKLRDICDGNLFKQNTLYSSNENALQVILYYDDFNIVNPLGNRVRKYKLSAFYMTLGNLNPIYRSQNKSIFLVSLCRTKLLKKHGFNTVLAPLERDLQQLEVEGITFNKGQEHFTIKGSLVCTCCDNLASHSIGGFIESFTTLKPCRFGHVTLENLRNGETGALRSQTSYDNQCDAVQQFPDLSRCYGIKKPSYLNNLNFYHVVNGLPSDIAHDIFEGVGKVVLSRTITYCIQSGFYSLEYLNSVIENYPFKADDKTNRPCNLDVTHGKLT